MSNKRKKKRLKKAKKTLSKKIKKCEQDLSDLHLYLAMNPAHHYLVHVMRESTHIVLGFAIAMTAEEVTDHLARILGEIDGRVDISTLPRLEDDYADDVALLEAGYDQHRRLYGSH